MGFGDEILGAGLAKGAKESGKRIAFGDDQRIIWSKHADEIFRNNPNIARPGDERVNGHDLDWIAHYPGNRVYNKLDKNRRRWIWNYDFKARPGEIFFSDEELKFAQRLTPGFVLIEPNVPYHKPQAVNKDWPHYMYQHVAEQLIKAGHRVVQLQYATMRWRMQKVIKLPTGNVRYALAALSRAGLYLGPEGGMHHGAAALGIPAVVLFGGFSPPEVLGYKGHVNLTGGTPACGLLHKCAHCAAAMAAIKPKHVIEAALRALSESQV